MHPSLKVDTTFPIMKKILTLLAIIIAALVSCTAQPFNKNIEADKVKQLLDEGVTVIDVRTPQEYSEGYIKGANNIDWYASDFLNNIEKLNHQQPVVLYCRSGNRSVLAAAKLQSLGFTKIYSLTGGINNWQASGFPVEN